MLWLSTVLQSLILPPGFALAALAVALLLLRRGRRRAATALIAAAALALYALATPSLSQALLRPLEAALQAPATPAGGCDVIVVLGSGLRTASEAVPPEMRLDDGSLRRTLAAWRQWRVAPRPILLLGGQRFADDPPGQSLARADLLRDLGVPAGQLYRLDAGRTTHGEAQAVAGLAPSAGWRRICLVTSAWHLPRAMATFRHAGLALEPVPCDFATHALPGGPRRWLPSAGALAGSSLALHEYVGRLYYRLRHGVPLSGG